jgi:hypothetical protein
MQSAIVLPTATLSVQWFLALAVLCGEHKFENLKGFWPFIVIIFTEMLDIVQRPVMFQRLHLCPSLDDLNIYIYIYIYLANGFTWLGSPHLPFSLKTEADTACETVLVYDMICWTGSNVSATTAGDIVLSTEISFHVLIFCSRNYQTYGTGVAQSV